MFRSSIIQAHSLPLSQEISAAGHRVLAALEWVKKPLEFKVENLDEKQLDRIAKLTNSAAVHCSGNCTLLSMLLTYNLKLSRLELSAKNISPFYQGLSPADVGRIVLTNHDNFVS